MYKTQLFEKLAELYNGYDVTSEVKHHSSCIIINNPHSDGNIEIYYDGEIIGTSGEILLSFSYHHGHFYDFYYPEEKDNYADYFVKDLSETINKIIENKIVAVGFLVDEEPVLCGVKYAESVENLSAEEIFESLKGNFGGSEYFEKVKARACHCVVRGWNSNLNKDLYFVI